MFFISCWYVDMKRRAARRRTLPQQRETNGAMTSKSMAQHKVSKKV
jgi:hypothetical protein